MAKISNKKVILVISLILIAGLLTEFHFELIQNKTKLYFKSLEHHAADKTPSWTDPPSPDQQEEYYSTPKKEGPELSHGVIIYSGDGIGNQLYRYACLYALAKDLDRPLYIYVPEGKPKLAERQFLPDQRHFVLDKFQIPMDLLIDEEDSKLIPQSSVGGFDDVQLLFKDLPEEKPFLLLHRLSFCQSESYWTNYKDEILSMFQFRPEVVEGFQPYCREVAKDIEKEANSVCVHVRRGDFSKRENVVDISYQRWGIQAMIQKLADRHKNSYNSDTLSISPPKYFVFSDDIDYVKDELSDLAQTHQFQFVSSNSTINGTNSLEDFYLMTKCRHFIIPNSTFSWWAAYLSTEGRGSDGIVIVSEFTTSWWKRYKGTREQKWFYRMLHKHAFYPKSWIVYYPK